MEPVSKLLGKLRHSENSITAEQLACAAWRAAVGKKIAQHARPEKLVRDKLVIAVDDAVWQKQLFHMSRMILTSVENHLGKGIVADLEFRVAPPRRGPQRAASLVPARPADEADRIEDPVLRGIYLASRKKASA